MRTVSRGGLFEYKARVAENNAKEAIQYEPTDTTPQQKPSGEKSSAQVSLNDVKPLEDQLRETFGRTVYSHKTHIIQAGMYQTQNWWIKTGEIVLGAATTTGLIVTLFGKDNQVGLVVSAICSALLTALIAYTKDFDLGTVSEAESAQGISP